MDARLGSSGPHPFTTTSGQPTSLQDGSHAMNSAVAGADAVPADLGSSSRGLSGSTTAAQQRERRSSQRSNSSQNSRRNSGSYAYKYPQPAGPSAAATSTATFAQAQFGPSTSPSTRSNSSSMSMLQGIEAQLQIPPFRGGPQAQRTHSQPYTPRSSSTAASGTGTPNLGSSSNDPNSLYNAASSQAVHQRIFAASMLTPPASSPGSPIPTSQLAADAAYLYSSHQPSSSVHPAMYLAPNTPAQRQGAPKPAGVVTSAATTSAAAAHASNNRNRASHQIMPVSAGGAAASPPVNIALHTAQYNVPGQRKICFGDYQLLHTLGEGEFGKVKLGVHKHRWGEEVAIKLIKRGSIENSARSMKVTREIDVLKMVKHPHIVRLHEVVETDRFIGIVLEYASGGELFEYILAHKHLRENMACKLFAQLISGVAYLHSKKIVHRDLKLENLLLDRNKDIVITDFGFANRFNDTGSDLMATSCGSPCYAAPELVLHDGQYVGSAVDVWSCGVILYAMLSGYLPYDDDPANPDGDNINLLYRYITTTQLSFPDWISPEPRELLLMMLVADPAKRCTLRDVMRHPWLKRYAPSFQKGVAELEMQAEAQYEEKRLLLARQQEHYFRSTGQALPPHLQRSQSSMAAFESQQTAQSMAQQRHRSAMVHSVTTQSMIPEFAAAPQNQQFQQPRPSLPIHLQGGLISPPLSPPSDSLSESTNRRPPASAYPAIQFSDPFAGMAAGPTVSSPLRQQQQQQLDASYLASSTAMQPSLSAPGDVETISDSLTSEGEMRGEPRSRKTDDDDASTTSSSNRGARSSAARGSSSMATPPIVPGSPAGTNLSNGDSKKRKGEEKRHTLPSLDYPASPPAESTRSKTKARDSLRDASDFPLLYHPDLPMPPVIAPFDRSSGRDTQLSMDPHMPIVEAAAAAESIDVHMQSPDASPARSTDDHNQSELSARAGQATSNGSTPGVATQPTVSPIEERGENILVSPASEQDRSLLPKMTAPQTLANQVTPPSSPRKEAVSPSRTPKRSNGSSAATAREALLADAQRTPKASAQQQQSLAQPAPSDAPRSSAVPFPSPSKEKRPSTAAATNFESADSGRGTTSSGKTSGSGSRHKKGLSISRLLGSSTTSVDRTDVAGEPSRSRKDSLQASRPPSAGPQGGLNSIEEDLSKSRNRRRKALSLVVDPFGRSSTSSSAAANAQAQAKNRRSARVQPISGSGSQLDASTDRTRAGTQGAARPSGLPASASAAQFPVSPSMASVVATPGQSRASLLPGPASQLSQSTYQPQAVEAKQRKRMSDWFKWSSSSSSRDNSAGLTQSASVAGGLSGIPAPPNTKRNSTSTRPQSMAQPPVTRSRQSTATQPTVVVTSANAIARPQAQAQQQPQTAEPPRVVATPAEARTFASTHRSTLTAQRSLRNKVVGASEASYDGAFDDSKLKVHSGAANQHCITKNPPIQVMQELKKTLQDMGMDIERDGDFRYRVTRRSRKQVSQQAGGSTVTSPSLGAMSPSPSSTFRSFFGRKNSAATTGTLTGQSMPSPALTTSSQLENGTGGSLESAMLSPTISNHSILQPQLSSSTNATVAASQKVNAVVPFYGGKSDSGGEVRYSVEVTRVRGLTGLYTLDFRRMKGSLSDYKANHDALLDRLDLGSPL